MSYVTQLFFPNSIQSALSFPDCSHWVLDLGRSASLKRDGSLIHTPPSLYFHTPSVTTVSVGFVETLVLEHKLTTTYHHHVIENENLSLLKQKTVGHVVPFAFLPLESCIISAVLPWDSGQDRRCILHGWFSGYSSHDREFWGHFWL